MPNPSNRTEVNSEQLQTPHCIADDRSAWEEVTPDARRVSLLAPGLSAISKRRTSTKRLSPRPREIETLNLFEQLTCKLSHLAGAVRRIMDLHRRLTCGPLPTLPSREAWLTRYCHHSAAKCLSRISSRVHELDSLRSRNLDVLLHDPLVYKSGSHRK